MNETIEHDVSVVVVGGGPVGLVAALALARLGVDSVVLEAGEDRVRAEWRGSTLHPPTLEILDALGLVEDVLGGSVRVDRLDYRDLELPDTAKLDYATIEDLTRYPFRTQFEQYKLLRLLRDAAAANPLTSVEFGTAALDVTHTDSGAEVTARGPAGTRRLRCAWVVGADGAHATTRKQAGIDFPGFTYEHQSLIVATPFPFEDNIPDLGTVGYWTGPGGRFSLIRTPDIWRTALSTTTPADAVGPAGTHPAFTSAIDLLLGRDVAASMRIEQHQLYRSHQRVATTFRRRRLVLAGDAAHLSSTTGGMGLNSGVHDAWELAPAIATALRTSDDSPLDRYAEHRRAVAVELIQPNTIHTRSAADAGDRESRRARLAGLRRTAQDPAATREHLRVSSMIGMVTVAADA